jgi:hypothetical protein
MSIFHDSHETPLVDEILSLVAYWRGGSSFACFKARHVNEGDMDRAVLGVSASNFAAEVGKRAYTVI